MFLYIQNRSDVLKLNDSVFPVFTVMLWEAKKMKNFLIDDRSEGDLDF